MDHAVFQRWLDDYVEAWRTYDEETIGALFSDHASYRYHPWDEGDDAVLGREAIVAGWLIATTRTRGTRSIGRGQSRDRAVAIGTSRYLAADGDAVDREFHNVFLCRFDDDGRCCEFTELYLERKRP
jgi:hypothetical protein